MLLRTITLVTRRSLEKQSALSQTNSTAKDAKSATKSGDLPQSTLRAQRKVAEHFKIRALDKFSAVSAFSAVKFSFFAAFAVNGFS
jgi:hypothetical protein